jgi:Tol biopolymer transport system component/tRNA A-37 threonylcarbamoyl transferase component Bud32
MALMKGARIGVYEILDAIGAGGMGEVYRARDTRLGRDVALKILPELFANDPDRLARFQREAQLLAALNHPHIAAIYGFEEEGSTRGLALELVDGPTLADRIAQGPLPLDEALPIALQIVDALEAAHAQGIIHRDLKPANIKLRPDGTVKVLDFGLAKALDPRASDVSGASPSISPTLTAATELGMILGTAAYMSPEQARGKPVDKRADIWAVGCVLYEMITGQRAFPGDEITDVLAFVITKEPDWTALPATTPPALRRLLHRCLHKDRKQRLADIADARLEIEEARTMAPAVEVTAATPRVARWQIVLPWLVAAVIAVAFIVTAAPWRAVAPNAIVRLTMDIGADASLLVDQGAAFALSPDGQILAFVAQSPSAPDAQLYVRRLEQLQALALAGTAGARNPFFSPDGEWIGFFADAKLKKISRAGGAAVTLCDAPRGRGGTWMPDGTIVFTPQGAGRVPLQQVSAAGGQPTKLPEPLEGELVQRFPQVLPGGKAVLYTVNTAIAGGQTSRIVVQPLPSGERLVVRDGGFYARYLPSGHVAYIRDGTLFVVAFDADRLAVTGEPIPIVEGVMANASTGGAQFAVSDTGTLMYVPGGTVSSNEAPISWLDRSGNVTPLRTMVADWSNPAFSPDGRKLAFDITGTGNSDVWIYEWDRDANRRLTTHSGEDLKPVWTPDGSRIVYGRRDPQAPLNMYWQRADGTGEPERLVESPLAQEPSSFHPSGRFLAFTQGTQGSQTDAMILPLEGDERTGWKAGTPIPFANTAARELEPMFSPDGRWIAYFSDESGRQQVYVRPFPGPGGKWLVSTGPGQDPAWSKTGQELFYWTGALAGAEGQVFVVPFRVHGAEFVPERPQLVPNTFIALRGRQRDFNVHPDGKRFVVAAFQKPAAMGKQDKVVAVFNFSDEIRRLGASRVP